MEGFTGNVGDDIDPDEDGTLDSTPWLRVVDSIGVADSGGMDRTYAETVLEQGFDGLNNFTVGGASRIPDGQDTNSVNDWVRNDFDLAGIEPNPGSPRNGEAFNTPGAANEAIEISATPLELKIREIQGAGHVSPVNGNPVMIGGIVTAVDARGFYMQDPEPDDDIATSEGIFVFTSSAPSVLVGDEISVTGTVSEFRFGSRPTDLTVTQITWVQDVTVESSNNPLPDAVILGTNGRVVPNEVVEDDNFTSFDPEDDGIDFFESLEGMRVRIEDPVAVSGTNRFNETWTLTNNGAEIAPDDARTERGGINLQPDPDNLGDQNPERVQIQYDNDLLSGFAPPISVGDELGDVTGVMGYSFGNFEVNVTDTFSVDSAGLQPETTHLDGDDDEVTVASYNVLNLSSTGAGNGSDPDAAQRETLAQQIVHNLKAPDVIALQEIQDNTGTDGGSGNTATDATQTLQDLVDAIEAAGGPRYSFFDVAPDPNTSGGVPGGNIRNAFLFNADRVDLEGYMSLTPDILAAAGVSDPDAFIGTRNPLLATFSFDGEEFTVINNHFTSRFGSSPIFGTEQPIIQAGEDAREAQSQALNECVDALLANDPDAKVMVVGDLNTFEFTDDLTEILPGTGDEQILTNLVNTLDDDNIYSFNFEGNSQQLDHFFVTENLEDEAEFDVVHLNVDFPRTSATGSDHEALLAQFEIEGDDDDDDDDIADHDDDDDDDDDDDLFDFAGLNDGASDGHVAWLMNLAGFEGGSGAWVDTPDGLANEETEFGLLGGSPQEEDALI